ncbi:MAG: glycosyltransferase [Longimicrobiales bacterium]
MAESRTRLVHLVPGEDRSGLFTGLARYHDRGRFELSFLIVGRVEEVFSERLRALEIPTRVIPYRGWSDLASGVSRATAWLCRERVDVLHAHIFQPSLLGMVAATLAGVPLKVVTRHHSDYHFRGRKWAHLALDRLTMDLADGVIAVSNHTRDFLLIREKVDPVKVRVIHNGILEGRIPPTDPSALDAVRQELGLASGFSVLLPGRLHPEKGTDILFKAVRVLKERGLTVRVLLAGEGPFRRPFEEEVRRLGLRDQVSFLGFRDDVVDLMRAVDLVVLPSRVEAFGLVALEALAAGAALVASSVGGIREIVTHEKNGILVPPEDEMALALEIQRMLTDPPRKEAVRANAGSGVFESFGFPMMVERYEDLYGGLLRRI